MKRSFCLYLSICFLIISLSACKHKEQGKGSIAGQLKNADHQKIYLERITETGDVPLDSTSTDANGNFTLPNRVDSMDYYLLRADDHNLAYLILKGGENVNIKGDAKNLEQTYEVEGSDDSRLLLQMKRFERHISDSINKIYTASRDKNPAKKDSVGMSLQHKYDSLMRNFAIAFVSNNPTSIVSLSASLYLDRGKDLDMYFQLNKSLTQAYPGNAYIIAFEKQVEEMKNLPVGSMAPEISLTSPEGKEKSLSSFKGKLVLIDFWASWCGPCRKEMPQMVELYRRFKNNGFEIFGVSLDDNHDAWKEAISHDKITWTQVSDLKKWDSQAAKAYGVEEIPYTVLVDRDGMIAAKGLHGTQLELKIQELLMKQ